MKYFSKTNIGYSHLQTSTPCQDFASCYHDEERTIITACDGHGGRLYLRSDRGSRYASTAVTNVFKRLERGQLLKRNKEELCRQIRLQILCEWNALVERDLSKKRLQKGELAKLTEGERWRLLQAPVKAYGTTLQAVMVLGGKLVCASLGDGGLFLVKNGKILPAFDDEDEPVANLTYSLCQENAFEHLKVGIFSLDKVDGALVCTDGVMNPYQNLTNFQENFVKPVCSAMQEGRTGELGRFIKRLGEELGVGDDVSLAITLKDKPKRGSYEL